MAFIRTFKGNFKSTNTLNYYVEFYDKGATASAYADKNLALSKKGLTIDFGSEGSDIHAPIKASRATIEFMVDSTIAAQYMNQLRINRQEGDIYVHIYRRETYSAPGAPSQRPIFTGFILLDLSDDRDQALPYPVTLKAIDGLAALKYFDWIPTTTTQVSTHLYQLDETHIPIGFQTFRYWIQQIIKSGRPSGTDQGLGADYRIITASNWYNGNMPDINRDPLESTKCKMRPLYTKEDSDVELVGGVTTVTRYKAPTCYDVLIAVCKLWGMRCFIWENSYYFISINNYSKNETGTLAIPDNINNYTYGPNGSTSTLRAALDETWGKYEVRVSSSPTLSYANKKKKGATFGNLPAIKSVKIDFLSALNTNYFSSFPLLPTSWYTSVISGGQEVTEIIGTLTLDGINNVLIYQEIFLDFINNNAQFDVRMNLCWTVRARPAGTATWTKEAFINWGGGSNPAVNWTTPFPASQQSIYSIYFGTGEIDIPPSSTITVNICDTSINGLNFPISHIPVNTSDFTAGEWEFGYVTKTWWTGGDAFSNPQGHGRTIIPTTTLVFDYNPEFLGVQYFNTTITSGIGSSQFVVTTDGTIGASSETLSLTTSTSDTEVITVDNIYWGDSYSTTLAASLQVDNGSSFVNSGFTGVWGIDTTGGSASLSELLGSQILARQKEIVRKFNVTTILSQDMYINDNSGSKPMYPTPFSKLTTPVDYSGYPGGEWIMNTLNFNVLEDEWSWLLYEFDTFATAYTSITTNSGGINTGPIGTGTGTPIPQNPIIMAMQSNPLSGGNLALNNLNLPGFEPIALVSTAQYMGTSVVSQNITFIDVNPIASAILTTGDTILLQSQSISQTGLNPVPTWTYVEFEVSSPVLALATRINVTSKAIDININIGDRIVISQRDLIKQYQNKTKGTIANFAVNSTSFTKGGVSIDNFIDDDSMASASATTLSTSESIKTYVDNNAGGAVVTVSRTITQAEWNALQTSPIELVPKQGSNKVILPLAGVIYIERNTTDTAAYDLIVGWNGTTFFAEGLLYSRRVMWNVTTDRVVYMPNYGRDLGTNLSNGNDARLTISKNGAGTLNAVTEAKITFSYYVGDIT